MALMHQIQLSNYQQMPHLRPDNEISRCLFSPETYYLHQTQQIRLLLSEKKAIMREHHIIIQIIIIHSASSFCLLF